jgi:DNA-binding NarL/FixJ family response regulator
MGKVHLLVVDDHGIVRQGIQKLLESWTLLGSLQTVANTQEAEVILNSPTSTINLLLLDISMPGRNGYLLAKDLRKKRPELKIVILSSFEGEALSLNLLKIGVHGFVNKEKCMQDLQHCLENVLEGRRCYPEGMGELANKMSSSITPTPNIEFNERERQIIPLLMQGYSSKQIADKLHLSERTVTTYRENMLKKTQTQSASELVAFIKENGLLR